MKIFLITFSIFLLLSCENIVREFSAGTLGALKEHYISCTKEVAIHEIDSLVKTPKLAVPDSLVHLVNWDEKGYDFLTHWTIFIEQENTNYLIWFSAKDSDSFVVSIRGSYDFKMNNWTYAKDINPYEAAELNNVFILQLLNKINC